MSIKPYEKLNKQIILILFCLILIIAFMFNFLMSYILSNLDTDKFYNGILINGVDVSGVDKEEAKSMVYKRLKSEEENIIIAIYCEDKSLELSGMNFDYEYNLNNTVDLAYNYARKGNLFFRYFKLLKVKNNKNKFVVKSVPNEESLKKNVNTIINNFDDPKLEAHVEKFEPNSEKMFVYAQGKDGYRLNKEEVTQQLKNLVQNRKSGKIYLKKYEYKNTTTIEDAKNRTQLIGEFKTISTNSYNSNKNMKLSMEAINGTILKPGEIFSFNKVVGDSNNPKRGFLPGASIINGAITMTYGGGICQAATTIYGAAIRADMTIIERRNHRFKSSYVPYGLDAAIDYKSIDLKFRNDLKYPVYIKATMKNKELECKIWGPKNKNFDKIEVNSWVVNKSDDIKVEAEKLYYKNNKIIKKRRLPSSVYKAK